jgi:ABC-type methionine transport system ATPase subunit
MSQGRIIEQGGLDQLYWKSSHKLTKVMLRGGRGAQDRNHKTPNPGLPSEIETHEEVVR